VVLFHTMRERQFKAFYCGIVCRFMKANSPGSMNDKQSKNRKRMAYTWAAFQPMPELNGI